MKHLHLSLLFISLLISQACSAQWTSLATDGTGDGASATLLDGKSLSYRYDPSTDTIFFKIDVVTAVNPPFGINIVFAVTGAGAATIWNTPQNTNFAYNRVITAWYATATTGILGIADAMGFTSGNYTNIKSNGVAVSANFSANYYIVAVKRSDIYNGSGPFDADVIAAVGSNVNWNDDIPNTGSGHIHIVHTAITNTATATNELTIAPNPSIGIFTVSLNNATTTMDIRIIDYLGQCVYSSNIKNHSSVDLEGLAKGIYFVSIKTGETITTKQMTIQ